MSWRGPANITRRLVVTWLRKTAQVGGALPGYTGSRDDRIDSLGQAAINRRVGSYDLKEALQSLAKILVDYHVRS